MEYFQASLLALFAFLVTITLRHFLFRKPNGKNLPPGRTGFPVVGETLDFHFAGKQGQPEKFIVDRITKYSSQVFRTSILGSPIIVFCGAAGNKFLFSNENILVQGWWPQAIDKIFPSSTQNTSSKDEAINLRMMLRNFLRLEVLHRYIGSMDGIAQRHFASDWENKDRVVAFPLIKHYSFSIACRLFLSIEDPHLVARFAKPFRAVAEGLMSVPIDFPGTPFNRGIKASNAIRKDLLVIIKQRKIDLAEGKASPTQDILSHMLTTSDENGKFMNELDISDKIFGLLVGGHDNPGSTCVSIVKYLAELPEVYKRVYNEQIEIAHSKAQGELLNWDDIQKMKYSWNVAREALRLTPPTQGTFREAITDFVYNGFSIPKGWKLYWSVNSTHKNPKIFPEPTKFDPSRFEGSGPAPFTFVPFGGGPRMCPGKEYTRLEILVFMHHLVKRFNWKKVIPNEKIVFDPIPNPENGLPIYLSPHKA